jgi:hypothetical protein
MDDQYTPVEVARLLAGLVDVLLPGAEGWPSGATVGVQFELATRLIEQRGEDALDRLVAALRPNAAALLNGDEAAVAAWEARDPELFGWVRDAAYMAYYESPVVALAITAKGHPYQLRPHTTGYKLPRFDPARDTPTHGRGRYIATHEVARVTGVRP